MDNRIEKWRRWCDGTIRNNVLTMHLQRDAWEEVAAILKDNAEQLPESYWWQFMFDTYAHTAAMAVRRQADTHKDAASLGKLISEIASDPRTISRATWLDMHENDDPYWRRVAERHWDEAFAGTVGTHVDPAIPRADLAELKTAARDATHFADKHVAHADSSAVGAQVTLTLDDVHAAVTVIGKLFVKYHALVSDGGYSADQLVPAIQHNWKAIFHLPWARPLTPRDRGFGSA